MSSSSSSPSSAKPSAAKAKGGGRKVSLENALESHREELNALIARHTKAPSDEKAEESEEEQSVMERRLAAFDKDLEEFEKKAGCGFKCIAFGVKAQGVSLRDGVRYGSAKALRKALRSGKVPKLGLAKAKEFPCLGQCLLKL